MKFALAFSICSVAWADETLSLLQKHAIKQTNLQSPGLSVGGGLSGMPAGCQPELIGENKKCSKNQVGMLSVGYSAKVNGWGIVKKTTDGDFNGILGAWDIVTRGTGCCSTKFQVCDHGTTWHVSCPNHKYMESGSGDMCDTMEDDPKCFVYDAATASCGTEDLKDQNRCTIGAYQIKENCEPKLVAERSICSKSVFADADTGRKEYPGQAHVKLAFNTSIQKCMGLWASGGICCGARIDWDPVSGECGCAKQSSGWGGVPWFCNEDGGGPQSIDITGNQAAPNKTWQYGVYDIGHCMHPHLHDCPLDSAEFRADPCKKVVSGTVNQPLYSNLASQGPDSGNAGILYPDAVTSNGVTLDLKITSPNFASFKPSNNGASGGLGKISVMSGTEAEVTALLTDKSGQPVKIDGTLAITFLDLDEGKKGRSRTTVSSCQAISVTAGSELTTDEQDDCKAVSSSKRGTGANDPPSLDGITEDHKLRAATFMFDSAIEYNFKIGLSKGNKGRNVHFVLTPVLGC